MKQLTLRGFDEALERHLRGVAQRLGVSLNKAALLLMRKGAGLDLSLHPDEAPDVVGSTLDRFIGTWSPGQEQSLLTAIAELDRIDEALWR